MTHSTFSRRSFLTSLAAGGGTAAMLAGSGTALASIDPVVVSNYPLVVPEHQTGRIKILCTHPTLSHSDEEKIRSSGKNVDLIFVRDQAKILEQIVDADAVLGRIEAEAVAAARKLKWVQFTAAGIDELPQQVIDHPSILTNMQRVYAPVIAESALGLTLSLTRGLAQDSIPNFKAHRWASGSNVPLVDLYQKTMGIVGLGGIGTETARRAHYGFEMKILAVDPKPLPKPAFVEELREPGWLMEMLPQVDVLVSCAPMTKESAKMFNAAVFNKMKPTAYFINVSRGGLVDQDALVNALKSHRIAGAGLDVTSPEPLPSDHPLWDCPNLVITPHNSGAAPIRQVRVVAMLAENVRRYSNGLPLLNVVDKTRGY